MKTKNGTETVYTYNELNQLVYDSGATYEYDLNGNLVRVIGGAQSALYEYNSENKLVKATVQQGINVVEETYTYDYAGNRTSKSTHTSDGNSEFVKYLNDNSSLTNVLAELDSEGNVQVYYTIGADLISQERDGRTYTYLYDGHGSVVGLMNESGSVTDTYTYDAFGNLLKSTGRTANNYRYCGEQFDSTTGLYYLRARYMDTSTGRFISQDSYAGNAYDPVSLHKYLYANSNPVTYSDPSGYFSLGGMITATAISGIIGGISGGITAAIFARRNINMGYTNDSVAMQIVTGICSGILIGFVFGCLGYLAAHYILARFILGMIQLASAAYSCYMADVYDELNDNLMRNYMYANAAISLVFALRTLSGGVNPAPKNVNADKRTPAQQVADSLGSSDTKAPKNPTNPAKRINTVAVLRTKDGINIIDYNSSKGNPTNARIGSLLEYVYPNKYNGKCAEVNVINRALNMGLDINDSSISTAFVGGGLHGVPHEPCGVCSEIMWILEIIYNGGLE